MVEQVGSCWVVFITWEDKWGEKRGATQKNRSEVRSRHHLLQMFAAINLVCSGCTVWAAAEMDDPRVKSAEGTQKLTADANGFYIISRRIEELYWFTLNDLVLFEETNEVLQS